MKKKKKKWRGNGMTTQQRSKKNLSKFRHKIYGNESFQPCHWKSTKLMSVLHVLFLTQNFSATFFPFFFLPLKKKEKKNIYYFKNFNKKSL